MSTIGTILGGFIILCMVAYIIRIVVEGTESGSGFIMKNPPKPPQKHKTLSELKLEIAQFRASLTVLECEVMDRELEELTRKMSHIKKTDETM